MHGRVLWLCEHLITDRANFSLQSRWRSFSEKEKGRDGMAAFIGEFFVELIKFFVLVGVSLVAIFCGKKLRDRKDAKRSE